MSDKAKINPALLVWTRFGKCSVCHKPTLLGELDKKAVAIACTECGRTVELTAKNEVKPTCSASCAS